MAYKNRNIIEVSYSSLGTFENCSRRFAYTKMIRRPRPFFEDGLAASIGRVLHAGIQDYFIHRDRDRAIMEMALEYPWDKFQEDKDYNFEACVITFERALRSPLFDYELVYIDLLDGDAVPAVEVPVMISYYMEEYDVTFRYRGYIDLILRDPISGEYMIWDIKTMTTKTMGHTAEKYQYDYQNTGYGVILNSLYGTQAQFTTGIFGVITSLDPPETITPTHRRRQPDIDEFIRWFTYNARLIAEQQDLGWFPRSPKACKSFNRMCSFHDHCHLKSLDEMQDYVNPSLQDESEPIYGGTQRKPFEPLLVVELSG